MTLFTLEEYQKQRRVEIERARLARQPHPNGIACPRCGEELWDSDPTMTLASNPPQKNIHCPSCKWVGYALK